MGRTLPSITQAFLQEQESFSRFRRALRRSDQNVLDDLFSSAHQHLAAAAYAAHPLPFETFLLAMLLEEHKRLIRLERLVEDLLVSDHLVSNQLVTDQLASDQLASSLQLTGLRTPNLPLSDLPENPFEEE
jgi:hypothetical protein